MNDLIRILFVEDHPADMELAEFELRLAGIDFISRRVETKDGLILELNDFNPDIVISDYAMPIFDGMQALQTTLNHNQNIPVIMFTGSGRELTAVECMRAGATDYVIKEHITRLPFAVKEALLKRSIKAEKEKADQALRKSEERLNDIIFSMADWVWEVDANGVYTYSSEKGYELLGSSIDEILGKTPFDFMPGDEAKRVSEIFSEIVAAGKPITNLENWNIGSKGERICLLTNGVPIFDENGNLAGYRGVDKDITARKMTEKIINESEMRFRSLFENMLNGFAFCQMIYDSDGNPEDFIYLKVNEAFAKLTGLSAVEGRRVSEIIPGIRQKDDELFKIYGRVALTGIPEYFEIFLQSLNEWYSISVYSQMKNHFVAVFDVITERKKSEDELKNMMDSLEKMNKHLVEIRENERTKMSREIHDQLGQSLTALKIDLFWLRDQLAKGSEEEAKAKGMIELLTSTVKDVQRISAELRPPILDDLGLAAAMEWFCEDFANRTRLQVDMDLQDVQANDMNKNLTIYRVMQEALTNIIRHAGAKEVHIKLKKTENDIVLIVKDDGIGIAPDKLNSSKSLGLKGMYERVKQSGGHIEIDTAGKRGTKVTVYIPEF